MPTYNQRTDDIVAYCYKADLICPTCIAAAVDPGHDQSPDASLSTEAALDKLAEAKEIDRADEYTFDSDDFPKVVFRDQINDDVCGSCWSQLAEPAPSVTLKKRRMRHF